MGKLDAVSDVDSTSNSNRTTPANETIDQDVVDTILEFAEWVEGRRHKNDTLCVNDRDRWFVTIILGLVSDPHHRVGKVVGRRLLKTWIERGGKLPIEGISQKNIYDDEQLQFAIRYMRDYGMPIEEISNALGLNRLTIMKHLKYYRETLDCKDDIL